MKVLFLDFETRSTCDIKKAGAEVYARHPSTEILCMGWALERGKVEIWKPEDVSIFSDGFEFQTVVAHNAAFELAIWNHVGVKRHGWPPLNPGQVVCTMAMAYAQALPGSLDKASAAAGIDQQKDMKAQRVMLQLAQPRRSEPDGSVVWYTPESSPEKFEILYEYCKQDVEVERQLYARLMQLSENEKAIWQLDYKINQRGIQIDRRSVSTAIKMLEIEKKRLDLEMRSVTKNAVATCTATGQLTDWLRFRGVKVSGVAKTDVTELLDTELPADCRRALELRREAAKSSTAKLEAMALRACDDGRIRGTTQYHGAGTGRWAGRGLQIQNFPRPKLSQDEIDDVFDVLGRGV